MTGPLRLPDRPDRRWALLALSLFFVVAGANHFVNPDVYVGIMPPWLPWHRGLVLASGAFEMAGGLAVLAPRLREAAGWGLVLLLVAVFPANLHMALEPGAFPEIPRWALYARLPVQALFMAWAWWATRPEAPEG